MQPNFGRREFLTRSALGTAGLMLTGSAAARADTEPPRVRRYVPLGKTGLEISDISFGSSRLRDDEALVRHALERGINYFDTAESYTGGVSETTIGKALRGHRDKVILASKTSAMPDTRHTEIMSNLEGSLRRLQTDRIDVYFNHAVNDVDRVESAEWIEFAERAKKAGKIRFTGMSGHAGRLIDCVDRATSLRRFDVYLLAYNFGQDPAFYAPLTRNFDMIAVLPKLPQAIERAKAKGIGVIAMKTLMGARLNDMRPYERGGATFSQAAFRWVLSNSDVDALIVSMTSREVVDEYLGASGAREVRAGDWPLLARYAGRNGHAWCRHGCSSCESACPNGVGIGEVLRTRMYAKDYGDHDLAVSEYRLLGAAASACVGCAAQSCAAACPHSLPIPRLTRETHALLA